MLITHRKTGIVARADANWLPAQELLHGCRTARLSPWVSSAEAAVCG